MANKAPAPAETVVEPAGLDLDAYLAKRGLDARRVKIGGEWFEFSTAMAVDDAAPIVKLLNEDGSTADVLKAMLADKSRDGDLDAALSLQKAPLSEAKALEMNAHLVAYVLGGIDLGE